MPEIKAIISYGYDSNVYIIEDKKLALIDTGTGINNSFNNKITSELSKINREVDIIINTHAHFDHCGGNEIFAGRKTKICVHKNDYDALISRSFYNTKSFFDFYGVERAESFGKEIKEKDFFIVEEGSIIELGEIKLRVIHAPGHSKGSICLLSNKIKGKSYLFSGDTLFAEGAFGRFDLESGDLRELVNSLKRLKSLEYNILMPGHGSIAENGKKHAEKALKNILVYAGDQG